MLPGPGMALLDVFDVSGRRRAAERIAAEAGEWDWNLDVARFEPGVYVARLRHGDRSATLRFVVAR